MSYSGFANQETDLAIDAEALQEKLRIAKFTIKLALENLQPHEIAYRHGDAQCTRRCVDGLAEQIRDILEAAE